MTDVQAPPYPGKSPDLISLGDGLNYSAPLAKVQGTVVPNALFFLRSNFPPPNLRPNEWRVRIDGRVKRPVELDLATVRSLGSQAQETWMECAGNSRRRFSLHPAKSMTSSTMPGLISAVSTPSPTAHCWSGPQSRTGSTGLSSAASGGTGMTH